MLNLGFIVRFFCKSGPWPGAMFSYLYDSEVLVCFQITLIPGGVGPILGVK